MNKLDQTILMGIARTITHWQTTKPFHCAGDRSSAAVTRSMDEQERHRLAQQQTAVVDLAGFLGRQPTPSDSTQASRSYKALEAAGLIRRIPHSWSDRTYAIELLPAGVEMVCKLVGQEPAKERKCVGEVAVRAEVASDQPQEGPVDGGGTCLASLPSAHPIRDCSLSTHEADSPGGTHQPAPEPTGGIDA